MPPHSNKPKAYISGALTGVPNVEELKQFYEAIAGLCIELGIEPYVPHLNSDPVRHAHIPPRDVYWMDYRQVAGADLTILYAGVPSFGPGQEAEIAKQANREIVLMYEEGKRVSRMLLGNPTVVATLTFSDHNNALTLLRGFLIGWLQSHPAHVDNPQRHESL